MFPLKLFQTLDDRDNPQQVEDEGPFNCNWPNTWLGDGYYFWDGHIDLAHWWGRVHRNDNYIICEADAVYDLTCWDLHGRSDLREEFKEIVRELEKENIYDSKKTVVSVYIEYLKKKAFFNQRDYSSIRILGSNSVRLNEISGKTVWQLFFESRLNRFTPGNFQFVQPVQLCLFNKRAHSLEGYRVVYPEHHREDYQEQVF